MTEPLAPLPTPNLPLLHKVLSHIDAHPEEWNQGQWITRGVENACGTACCIAGWAVLLNGDAPEFLWDDADDTWWVITPDGARERVADRAPEALGLTPREARRLFHPGNSREEVQRYAAEIAARAGEVL